MTSALCKLVYRHFRLALGHRDFQEKIWKIQPYWEALHYGWVYFEGKPSSIFLLFSEYLLYLSLHPMFAKLVHPFVTSLWIIISFIQLCQVVFNSSLLLSLTIQSVSHYFLLFYLVQFMNHNTNMVHKLLKYFRKHSFMCKKQRKGILFFSYRTILFRALTCSQDTNIVVGKVN